MADLYVVIGATGNTGRALAEILLKKGRKVRAVGRDAAKLKPLADKGAESAAGSLEDAAFTARALAGATHLYALIPPHYTAPDFRAYQRKVSESLVAGVKKAGVKKVVTLSSMGAHLPSGTGPIVGLRENEERFNALPDVDVLHLRPTYFMENHLMNAGMIKTQGINGSPLKPDVAVPMIATRDIVAAAAAAFDEGFTGKSSRELLGPRDYTMTETTRLLGAAVGRPDLKYVQFPYEAAGQAMLGMGLSLSLVNDYLEMYKGANDGNWKSVEGRSAKNTTPTTLEEFAKTVFAAVYGKD
jgi:uncharacterized protein YbjT (DUF2867 family)